MKYCINCGAQLEEGTVFCPNCGTRQPEEATVAKQPAQGPSTPSAQSGASTPGAPAKSFTDTTQQLKQQIEKFQEENTGDVNHQEQLGFIGSCKYALAHWNDFSTPESRRSIYWWFALGMTLAITITIFALIVLAFIPIVGLLLDIAVGLLVAVFIAISGISAMVRRMLYLQKSPWLLLLGLIPAAGGFILLYFMLTES